MSRADCILLVDDDADTLRLVSRYLQSPAYRILTAADGDKAVQILGDEAVDLVVTDLIMPGLDGLALTREVKRRLPHLPVLMMTAFASVASAVEAMKAGATDYIPKPIDPTEIKHKVARALQERALQQEVVDLKRTATRSGETPDLVGASPAIRKVMELIALVAGRDVPVILTGESGTGKEVAAKAIHAASSRGSKRFVAINCAAVPETLLESELFGFVRGAFTGAFGAKRGLFEEAGGGTLFLDEICDAPLSIQTKLLRVLQEGEIRRLGSTQSTPVNVRVLAASNRDLKQAIATGLFREDLYYRLSVVTVDLPPLRDRPEDIPLLADHFISVHAPSLNPTVRGMDPSARACLLGQPWRGNVRELENVIRRALVVAHGETLRECDVRTTPSGEASENGEGRHGQATLSQAEERFLRQYFQQVLTQASGNVSRAAEIAGISRKNVYEQLRRISLDPASFRRHP